MNQTNYPGMDSGMYQRSSAPANGGTVVPEMQKQAPGVETPYQEKSKAPVVGFLYSISRNGVGEFWPVCIGPNTIGRDSSCDISLPEATVSSRHAILNVKQLKSTKKIVAQIRDEGSKNGIIVNNEELDFGIHECFNNDIIRIGDNYLLLLILINPVEHGLSVAEEFVSTDEIPAPPMAGGPAVGMDNTNSPYSSQNRATNGTQAMDGSQDFNNGGTKFL